MLLYHQQIQVDISLFGLNQELPSTLFGIDHEVRSAAIRFIEHIAEPARLGLACYLPVSVACFAAIPITMHVFEAKLSSPARKNDQTTGNQWRLQILIEVLKTYHPRVDGIESLSYLVRQTVNSVEGGLKSQGGNSLRSFTDVIAYRPVQYLSCTAQMNWSLSSSQYPKDCNKPCGWPTQIEHWNLTENYSLSGAATSLEGLESIDSLALLTEQDWTAAHTFSEQIFGSLSVDLSWLPEDVTEHKEPDGSGNVSISDMMSLDFRLDSPTALGVASLTGIASHVAVFRVGEWDVAAHRLIAFFSILYASLIGFLAYPELDSQILYDAWYTASSLFGAFFAGMYTSMVFYRMFFHPLHRFPGPTFAPVSSLYAVGMSMKKFHMFLEVQKLHKSKGDFVRLGPSEMSVASPSGVAAIYQNSSPCLKGPWYNVFVPSISVQATRDKQEHAVRRKVWDRGLNAKALRDYEPRVEKYTRILMSQLEQRRGKPIDITEWFNFYGFDVMGDLAFGKSFNMLTDGVAHYYMKLTHTSTLWGTQFGRSSWLYLLMKDMPIVNYQIANFLKWLRKHVDERKKTEPELPDLFSWVLGGYREQPVITKQDELNLLGDAHLIVVAGSDTTSASLTCALFELARHPEVYQKLQKEVDELLDQEDSQSHSALAKLKYMQAVIDETMRLYPAIPSGLQRITPPQGLQIDDTFIPGNMVIQTPPYTLNRDERCFARPNEFIPERWTTRLELVHDASVFAPFSIGRYSCAGKQLGLLEIRHVLSQIVTKFDVRFAPGQTSEAFMNGLADGFTLVCPKLEVIFETRKQR
ncbi:hypothetical protein FDECE_3855 [Fusarium decemcellulare]|nr:hypothetical protein FDECE_3855 [Fusarium decemcellulare]